MRNAVTLVLTLAAVAAVAGGCAKKEAPVTQAPPPVPATPADAAPAGPNFTGRVAETMDSGGYTYVRVETGTESIWGAAPKFAVAVGDRVTVPGAMPMTNYHSNTLDRTFEVLYFAPAITPEGAAPAAAAAPMAGHPGGPIPAAAAPAVDFTGIRKAEGGSTVGELLAGASTHAGKSISVRGKVVKFNGGIMGKNWLHVQDGTGGPGQNDLTVTSTDVAKVGDTVLVRGVAAADKDFGSGYKFAFIVEEAKVVVE